MASLRPNKVKGLGPLLYYNKACIRTTNHEFINKFVELNSAKITADKISWNQI